MLSQERGRFMSFVMLFTLGLVLIGSGVGVQASQTTLVSVDSDGVRDGCVRELAAGQTVRVSVDSAGTQGNDSSFSPSLSADGQLVAFASDASNLVAGDTNGAEDIFVHNLTTGQTARVS